MMRTLVWEMHRTLKPLKRSSWLQLWWDLPVSFCNENKPLEKTYPFIKEAKEYSSSLNKESKSTRNLSFKSAHDVWIQKLSEENID